MKHYFALINAAWFQLAWFAAIIYKQQAVPWLIASILAHLMVSPTRKSDALLIIIISVIGLLGDSILSFTEVFNFEHNAIMPMWLVMVWMHFSIALNHSLKWLGRFHLWILALIGAAVGPINYFAGNKLGAVEFTFPLIFTLIVIAVIWAVNLPVFIIIQRWITQKIQRKRGPNGKNNQCADDNNMADHK